MTIILWKACAYLVRFPLGLLAPAQLVEQQVVGGHDGGRPVVGERVQDVRHGVAQRLRHVGHHRRVQLLSAQPGVRGGLKEGSLDG